MVRTYKKHTSKKGDITKIDELNAEMLDTCVNYMVGKSAKYIMEQHEDILFMQSIFRLLMDQYRAIKG